MQTNFSCPLAGPLLLVLLCGAACGGNGPRDPAEPPGSLTGELELSFTTSGVDLDPDGYLVRVDTASSLRVVSDGALTLSELASGVHEVTLSDIAENCLLSGDNPRSVTVESDATAQATFQVTCSQRFDGSTVDLEGVWILSDTTRPIGGTAPGGITNECRLSNVPIRITPYQAPEWWSANQEEGGTFACELNGVWGPETPLTVRNSYSVNKTGAEIHWWLSSRFSHYLGALTSANEMSGTVDPAGYGREGRWAARRQ